MKKVLSIFISVMLIVLSMPMVSFAATDVTVYAVGDNVTDGVVTGLSWQEANTVTVEFSETVEDPTALSVTLKEADGIRADVPVIVEATKTGAVVKLGKLRPLTDYTLTFDGDEFATTEITLQSEGTDMLEYWAFKRGAQGLVEGSKLTTVGFPFTSGAQDAGTYYNWPSAQSATSYAITYSPDIDLGNFTYEFDMAVVAGALGVAGVNKGYASNDGATLEPGKLTLLGTEITTAEKEMMNFRINFFRKENGRYYANAYLKKTVDDEVIWDKIISDHDFGKVQDGSVATGKTKYLTDMYNDWSSDTSRTFSWIRIPAGSKQLHWRKVTMSSLAETGVLDCTPNFEEGKIYLTFDQMIDTANSTVDIIGYDSESAEFTDAYNCVITLDENEPLEFSTTYEIDFSGVVADSGVIGGTGASFTTPKSDKLMASVANRTNLSWKEANTVEVTFSDAIVPSSFTETDITFTEKDGTTVDIPWKLDSVTANSATIKFGKFKPLTDYKLSITDVTPADDSITWVDSDIILQSASSDITEQWYGERGANGNVTGSPLSAMGYTTAGSLVEEGADSYLHIDGAANYYSKNGGAPKWENDLYQEYQVRVNEGLIYSAGTELGNFAPAYMVRVDADSIDVGPYTKPAYTASAKGWIHYRVAFHKDAEGIYYGTAYIKTADENGDYEWVKVASDFEVQKRNGNSAGIGGQTTLGDGYWFVTKLGYDTGTNIGGSYDIKKFVLSSMAKTGIMDCNLDLDNNKIELMFDQKIDTVSADTIKVYPKGGTAEDAVEAFVDCDGINCTITFDEVLDPGTEYTVDMSGIKADCGVLGCEDFDFTTDMADVDVTAMSIGDGLLTSSVTVKKNVPGSKKITIILALYDGGNSMVKANYLTKTITTNDEITYTDVAITDAEVKTGYKAKLMVWEGEIGDVTPICEATEK